MVRACFPGSFDPIHLGHIDIAVRAASLFDELVIGVYDRPNKNLLFTAEERYALVQQSFDHHKNIRVMLYDGMTVTFCRAINAQVIIRGLRVFSDFEYEFRMSLANRRLDSGIETLALITSEDHTFLSSTTVREIAELGGDVSSMVPSHVAKALREQYPQQNEHQMM